MSYLGYDFYFKIGSTVLTLPITPAELTITHGSNNKVVTLISEGDVNILKSPSLTEIEFEARFPMRKYPFSREPRDVTYYLNKFEELKTKKKSFTFIVTRSTPNGKQNTWSTTMKSSLEDFKVKESADEGDDVIVAFKLKQYKEDGGKTLKTKKCKPETTSNSENERSTDNKTSETKTYTVRSGDCLWNIAKAFYNDGSKYTLIYNANKTVIEDTANKHRNGKGSSHGHWIYPNTKLIIPAL